MLLFIAGCMSAKYNARTGELSYTRFGDQKLSGVHVETSDPNGNSLYIYLDSQKSEARLLQDALSLIEKGIEIGAK
jgi:hypothetical protein